MLKNFLILLILINTHSLNAAKRKYPHYWKTIKISGISQKTAKKYMLELIDYGKPHNSEIIILFLPGFFQNAYSFDLLPDRGISVVDYLDNLLNFSAFSLHPNGVEGSSYVNKSGLDDIAIDDIRIGVNYLHQRFPAKKIFLFGHSNGAITMQAYLGGLSKCGKLNCFNKKAASLRQEKIAGIIVSAGNTCLSDDRKNTFLKHISKMGTSLKPILKRMGYVSTRFITDLLFPNKKYHQKNILTENFLWKILYNPKNVSREAKAAIYDRTIDGVSAKSLIDFGEGIKRGCLFNSSGESYQVGLNNIHKPFLQMTYELDVLANPFETLRDHFNYIGTDKEHRYFYSFEDQGHEDFLMAEKFHQNLIHVVDFIQKYR